ncbi:hypothetical protein [Kamptonema sp. UHCC 0994]|uniref:hypothetical protein n=1 Tax=Kamptonema sp. UHCC 0994 TaxID=3031329 RepID=UPI0023BA57B3|nr:hypothetical protein [Kamptonema sp. UHCC 0994]MDF0556268.1 hypothetical protein [Kamptonema sp. UHCC 0994]
MQSQNRDKQLLSEIKDGGKGVIIVQETRKELAIADLGWSEEETKETYYRLLSFKEDWEAPGMEAYDEL